MYEAIDCMGFAGGFTLGMVQAGFKLVGKRELPGGFGVPNCEANRHLLGNAWRSEVGPAESWSAPSVPVVFGNPPCSGFSVLTTDANRGVDARINQCMWAFIEFAARCNPVIVCYESVQAAFTEGRSLLQALRERLERNTGERYNLYHVVHNAYELGNAQRRRRYFFMAVREDYKFGVDWPTVRPPMLRDVLDDLAGLAITWESQPYRRPATWWTSAHVRSPEMTTVDGHHGSHNTATARVYDVLRAARECGDGWPLRTMMAPVLKQVYEKCGELPASFGHRTAKYIENDFQLGFYSQPKRWDNDRPANVIVGQALHMVIHPTEDRLLTHREAARLMGFPDDWRISTIERSSALPLTWGKGITTQCGKWIGSHIQRMLDGNPGEDSGTQIGDREYVVESRPKYGKQLQISDERNNVHV